MSSETSLMDMAIAMLPATERENAEEWQRIWDGEPTKLQPFAESFHVTPADLLPPDNASRELHGYWAHEVRRVGGGVLRVAS